MTAVIRNVADLSVSKYCKRNYFSRKKKIENKTMRLSDGEYDDKGAMVEIKSRGCFVRAMGCPTNYNLLITDRK